MKSQETNSSNNPSIRDNREKMMRNRHDHFFKPLAAAAGLIASAALAYGGANAVDHFNSKTLIGTTQIDLAPSPQGNIATIENAVETIIDPSAVSGVTYEGHTIAKELEKTPGDSRAVTVSVYENNWPGTLKDTWVEASPTEESDDK